MNQVVRFLSSIAISTLWVACGNNNISHLKTDLGEPGNQEIADLFTAYTKKSAHCTSNGQEPRILLTGFGVFQSGGFNISGVVVQSMADEQFWPREFVSGESWAGATPAASGTVAKTSLGGEATMRRLSFNGHSYNVCFLILDVKWDLAGAILLHEMKLFKPNAIVMTGLGANNNLGFFEGGAINSATYSSGYHGDGAVDDNNRPIASYILPDVNQPNAPVDEIPMTWDALALAAKGKDLVKEIDEGHKLRGLTAARENNNYICNNISYITMSALNGRTVLLAGRKIQINSESQHIPAGFFHYPLNATGHSQSVFGWAAMWASLIPELVH